MRIFLEGGKMQGNKLNDREEKLMRQHRFKNFVALFLVFFLEGVFTLLLFDVVLLMLMLLMEVSIPNKSSFFVMIRE